MSSLVWHPDVEAVQFGPNLWVLSGPLAAVGAELDVARRAGLLFQASPPQVTATGVLVTVRVIEQRRALPAERGVPVWVWWACGGIAAAIATGVTVAVLLAWHFRAVIAGGLAVLLIGWWLLGRLGACPGIHCPGCGCS